MIRASVHRRYASLLMNGEQLSAFNDKPLSFFIVRQNRSLPIRSVASTHGPIPVTSRSVLLMTVSILMAR